MNVRWNKLKRWRGSLLACLGENLFSERLTFIGQVVLFYPYDQTLFCANNVLYKSFSRIIVNDTWKFWYTFATYDYYELPNQYVSIMRLSQDSFRKYIIYRYNYVHTKNIVNPYYTYKEAKYITLTLPLWYKLA